MQKITISISDRAFEYLNSTTDNRSKFINDLIERQEQLNFEHRLEQAYIDQEQDPEFHLEKQLWECVSGDGIVEDEISEGVSFRTSGVPPGARYVREDSHHA